jgi:hypothetical protein
MDQIHLSIKVLDEAAEKNPDSTHLETILNALNNPTATPFGASWSMNRRIKELIDNPI